MAKITILCVAALAALAAVHCDPVDLEANGNPSVVLVHVPTNFQRACDDCRRRGMEMFYPKNDAEHQFMIRQKAADKVDTIWTAASNDERDKFTWVNSGKEVEHDHWNQNFPVADNSLNCMTYSPAKDEASPWNVWENSACSNQHKYYCRPSCV